MPLLLRTLIEAFELRRGLQFAVEVAVDDLHEELAQVSEPRGWNRLVREGIDRIAEHARGQITRLNRHLRTGNAPMLLADETITQSMEPCRFAEERRATLDAFVECREKAHQANHPE